jgi:hypothetical protein
LFAYVGQGVEEGDAILFAVPFSLDGSGFFAFALYPGPAQRRPIRKRAQQANASHSSQEAARKKEWWTSTRLSRFGSATGPIPVMARLPGHSIHPATRRMKMMKAGLVKTGPGTLMNPTDLWKFWHGDLLLQGV